MICLDCNAAIAAFQSNPPPNVAVHRDRVRAFIRLNSPLRIAFPAVALSEYLWRADQAELDSEIHRVVGSTMFVPAFDEMTASISANLGRSYAAGRRLGDVARQTSHDRIALKADLLIVAIALQHSVGYFLTGDPGCHAVALHAKLNSILINTLPDPPPPTAPPPPRPTGTMKDLFEGIPEE
ncbi:MAG TPA: hypothetical protein VG122_26350 [Gemmata sp.]|nr:hypothetical protein [Gemmata sp.]